MTPFKAIPKGRNNRSGPILRTDVVDVQIFKVHSAQSTPVDALDAKAQPTPTNPLDASVEFLQLLRTDGSLTGTWQPIMGHAHVGESAAACALRELEEESGLSRTSPSFIGFWALEQVHPFFLSHVDIIMLSPRFCTQVALDWSPTLNHEHSAYRWVRADEAVRSFMWPGQIAAIREIIDYIVDPRSLMRDRVRLA